MTTTALPTPAEFLAQPSDPEDDVDDTPIDPLASIAESLRTLVERGAPGADAGLQGRYAQLDQQYETLARDFDVLESRLEQVREICKPSTSKLANAIRAVLEPAAVEVPAPGTEQPADDAPVEEWRAFGESRGLDLTDNLNRSQIRSALGIAQPAVVSA